MLHCSGNLQVLKSGQLSNKLEISSYLFNTVVVVAKDTGVTAWMASSSLIITCYHT